MKTLEKKTLYLCDGCRKMGVRSRSSKVFESFFCPRCNRETTLILPVTSMPPIPPVAPTPQVEDCVMPVPEKAPKAETRNAVVAKPFFSMVDFFIFMAGFISAILIVKG